MKKTLILFLILSFCSCKKTWNCECSNSNGTYVAGEVDGTKSQAKKYCKNLSSSTTNCYLQ